MIPGNRMKGPSSLSYVYCLLFLYCGLYNVGGEDLINSDSGGKGESSFQNRFSELLVWSKPVVNTRTLFFTEGKRKLLSDVLEDCPKREFFFGLSPRHMRAVSRLQNALIEQESKEDWLEMVSGFREQVNPHVWLRAVLSSAIHRKDLRSLRVPPMVEVIPSTFIAKDVLDQLSQSVHTSTLKCDCVVVDGSFGEDNGPENALWYFREDIMVNSHHWFWHLSYPLSGNLDGQPDRNGELFYFMHHDFIARYHSERLSSGLAPIEAWNLTVGASIPFGYNPHLHDGNSGAEWSARPPNVIVSDVPAGNGWGAPPISIDNRTIQRQRILDSISDGFLIGDGENFPLDSKNGITLLGNVVQANAYSVNPDLYGDTGIHNNGHIVVSFVLNPTNASGIPPGVMGDTGTSIRDLIFGPYHKEIDSIFKIYKNKLEPYQLKGGEWPLLLEGVAVQSLIVQSQTLAQPNMLQTFWNSKTFDLWRGLDFQRFLVPDGPLSICAQYLDHEKFEYELKINSTGTNNVTVRLFMGPSHDLDGRAYSLEEERELMFILDTFEVQLINGMNTIRRNSTETPLTIDFQQSLVELETDFFTLFPFCGCGWPQHMLIPKGNKEGLSFDVFAILTNAEDDKVEQSVADGPDTFQCQPAYIYCGLMGNNYPDARPMGYPFDRKSYLSDTADATLEDLVKDISNAALVKIQIFHSDQKKAEIPKFCGKLNK